MGRAWGLFSVDWPGFLTLQSSCLYRETFQTRKQVLAPENRDTPANLKELEVVRQALGKTHSNLTVSLTMHNITRKSRKGVTL